MVDIHGEPSVELPDELALHLNALLRSGVGDGGAGVVVLLESLLLVVRLLEEGGHGGRDWVVVWVIDGERRGVLREREGMEKKGEREADGAERWRGEREERRASNAEQLAGG